MVGHDVRHVEPPLRLTRRGRAVILLLFVLAAALASAVLFTTASRADAAPAGTAPTIAVRAGLDPSAETVKTGNRSAW
jgi:hypothetical protein